MTGDTEEQVSSQLSNLILPTRRRASRKVAPNINQVKTQHYGLQLAEGDGCQERHLESMQASDLHCWARKAVLKVRGSNRWLANLVQTGTLCLRHSNY